MSEPVDLVPRIAERNARRLADIRRNAELLDSLTATVERHQDGDRWRPRRVTRAWRRRRWRRAAVRRAEQLYGAP